MATHEETYKAIQGEVSKFMSEQQLINLLGLVENRLCELNQREEAEDRIYNSIFDYVNKYGDLEICVFAHDSEGQRVTVTPHNISCFLVKHATNT